MWLDFYISVPWMPFFTLAGLLQPASSDALQLWQWFGAATLLNVGIVFPFFIMFWGFFSYTRQGLEPSRGSCLGLG